ncbi:sugar ABC transporter substrate-binding protein [Candidatus Poriferisocius sp.]|uniref:sugar ABC transporter substrate-binding protein n=1 Tax=Candidatus Poriferisocius sp. TaxID=3101276 RepID=UPI003B59E2C5
MRRSSLLALLAMLLSLALVAAACGDDDDGPVGDAGAPATGEPDAAADAGGSGDGDTSGDGDAAADGDGAESVEVVVTSGDQRLRPEEEAGSVGVVGAQMSQSGWEVDFGAFDGTSIGIVGVLAVPEVTIQTDPCIATIEANGGSAEFVNANFDANAAVQAVETFLGRGDDAIWNVSNAGEALRPAIDAANADGTPFIGTYAGNEVGSADIREDEWAASPLIAQFIGNQLNGEGKVAVLGIPGIYTLDQRTHILKSVLAFEFPNIEVVDWPPGDGTPEGFRSITEANLQADPDIGAIFAHWDVPALGALQALDDLGRDDIVITSYTGDNVTGFDLLRSGDIHATVGQSNAQIGMLACEYLALALSGVDLPEDTLVPTGFLTANDEIPGPEGVFNAPPYVLNPNMVSN